MCIKIYVYIYMCVCAFFPLSLSLYLSLQGTVAMGALTEDVLAPISPTTGWCPFIAGIDWWLVETPPVEDGSSDPIPFSLSVISYGLKFKLVFFPKTKRGCDISRSLYFFMGFHELPWKPSSRHLERCHPQNQESAFQPINFCQLYDEFSRFHIWFGAEKYPKIVHDQLEESRCMSLIGLMSIPVVKMSSWFPSAWVFKFLK